MPKHSSTRTALCTLCSCVALAACSDSGEVITLGAEPEVNISLPDVLVNSDVLNLQRIRPIIQLSNGATVSLSRGAGNNWTGTVNVTAGLSYTATTTWLENYFGRDLPLAEMEQQLEISNDGTVNTISSTGYRTDLHSDSDGISNLQERENGTNPFDEFDNDESVPGNEDSSTSDDVRVNGPVVVEPATEPATGPAAGPAVGPDAEPEDVTSVTVDVVIPRIAHEDAPVIDGKEVATDANGSLTGEWSAAVQSDSSGAPLLIDNLMIDVQAEAGDGNPLRHWAALHDGTWLYLLVLVDDNGQRERDSGSDLAQDDSLELFIDGDNSKLSHYDSNDFHRILPVRLPGEDKQSARSGDTAGPFSSTSPLGLDFATGPGIGPDGLRRPRFEQDVYELRIRIDSAGIDSDTPFGLELQVNDVDDGGGRDSKWGWKHPPRNGSDVDGTLGNPSLMGTVKLE